MTEIGRFDVRWVNLTTLPGVCDLSVSPSEWRGISYACCNRERPHPNPLPEGAGISHMCALTF